jgi:hypothetical protein
VAKLSQNVLEDMLGHQAMRVGEVDYGNMREKKGCRKGRREGKVRRNGEKGKGKER